MSDEIPDEARDYFANIEAVPPLTAEEQRALWAAIKDGDRDTAKRRLVEATLRRVVSIAHQHEGEGMLFLDLVQEGNLGLIRAVERFDPSRNGDFEPFARQLIDDAMTDAIGRT